MMVEILNKISPYVRLVKIQKSSSLSGEWLDYDNVYTYIYSGEADFIINGIKYHVREGDVIVMSPFQTHIVNSTSSEPLVQYTFHFDLFYHKKRCSLKKIGMTYFNKELPTYKHEMLLGNFTPVTYINQLDQLHLKNKFLVMHKVFLEESAGKELLLKALAIELLALFIRNLSNQLAGSKMTKGWAFIEKALNYINSNYHSIELDNNKIGAAADVSPKYLSHIFKKQLGISLHGYINHIRIEKSKHLLLQNEKKFTEIASIVGFSSIHVFSKVFKKTVGMTPSEFMANNNVQFPDIKY